MVTNILGLGLPSQEGQFLEKRIIYNDKTIHSKKQIPFLTVIILVRNMKL